MPLIPLLKGILAGFIIAAPVGPVGILCVKYSLSERPSIAYVAGLGAAIADMIYSFLAIFSITIISDFLLANKAHFQWGSIILLTIIGIRFMFFSSNPEKRTERINNHFSPFALTFFLTLSNPMTIIALSSTFLALGYNGLRGFDVASIWIITGVFIGSCLCWLCIINVTLAFKHKISPAYFKILNKISGFVFFLFALILLFMK